MKQALIFCFAILVFSACEGGRVFDEFREIKGHVWSAGQVLQFHIPIEDTTLVHDVDIAVRNTGKYRYSNLFLFLTIQSPDGASIRDTVEITLADSHGKWLGKGAATVHTLYSPYRSRIRFPYRGVYTFNVEQAMWEENLKEITDIGLRIVKSGK